MSRNCLVFQSYQTIMRFTTNWCPKYTIIHAKSNMKMIEQVRNILDPVEFEAHSIRIFFPWGGTRKQIHVSSRDMKNKCWILLTSEKGRGEETNLGVDHKTLKPRFVYRPSAICHRRQLHDRRVYVYNQNAPALSSPSFLLRNWGRRRKKISKRFKLVLAFAPYLLLLLRRWAKLGQFKFTSLFTLNPLRLFTLCPFVC